MLGNGKKTIGVILERPYVGFQNVLCQGIIQRAAELDYNVAVLSSFGNYGDNDSNFEGDQNLFELPEYEKFSGVIVVMDTLVEWKSKERVLNNVKSRCKCPVIAARTSVDGFINLRFDNNNCMNDMIHHFVVDHGFKNICFMSGPEDNEESRMRLGNFLREMKKYGLEVDEHQTIFGDFWYNKGKEACDWFLSGKKKPDAIICANDYMAIAVSNELIDRGYVIPDDIAIAGFDGTEESLRYFPMISTTRVNPIVMGNRAVEIIDENQDNPNASFVEHVEMELITRESCGCVACDNKVRINLRKKQYSRNSKEHNREIYLNCFDIQMGECHEIDDMAPRIQNNIWNIENYKDYALCLCEDFENQSDRRTYTDNMELRISIKNNKQALCNRIVFERNELLPSEFINSDEPQAWYFTAIHFQNSCYGYEAVNFYSYQNTGNISFRWNVLLGRTIHNMVQEWRQQRLIAQLQYLYDKDTLTGMYNRRCLEYQGDKIFNDARLFGSKLYLAVIDMDGTKYINDNYGHEEGDFAIVKLCDIIRDVYKDMGICIRTGGDEFVVIAGDSDEGMARSWDARIESLADEFNKSGVKPYSIYVSVGSVCKVPERTDTISSFIKESDEIMYENKMRNKAIHVR